jgi:hypothetical protein
LYWIGSVFGRSASPFSGWSRALLPPWATTCWTELDGSSCTLPTTHLPLSIACSSDWVYRLVPAILVQLIASRCIRRSAIVLASPHSPGTHSTHLFRQVRARSTRRKGRGPIMYEGQSFWSRRQRCYNIRKHARLLAVTARHSDAKGPGR